MKINPNNSRRWDRLLFDEEKLLESSPIFIAKNRYVVNYLKNQKGNLLDIGVGIGYFVKRLQVSVPKLNLYGIDFSRRAVRKVKKKVRGEFKVSNLYPLDFGARFFNFVTILDVLEHVFPDEVSKVYKEIHRVLVPSGSLIISVPINENLDQLIKEGKNSNYHVREYTYKILEKELNKNKFTITKSKYLYAFSMFYHFKSLVVKFFPNIAKPNLLIIIARKS